ncbi:uncharacterized protein LOC142332735 [Lycorma delicatula]|uniref:uncharacterized protein LOC142332735 n=1 Tax=Lycorma delicatula TaxID=130591 RepID=UPI003F50F03C
MSDSNKVCRLCLAQAEVMCPIFSSHSSHGIALPQRIMSCAQIKVVEGDGLPASICHQCLAQVDKSYQFKLQCEKSDATLRKNFQENDVSVSVKNSDNLVLNGSSNNINNHNSLNGSSIEDEEEEEDEEIDDEEDSDVDDMDARAIAVPGGDSESVDGWEVMKFTPEVIINEEDSKGSGDNSGENGSQVLRNINSLAEQQLYHLSQVEAILRNHGTEIKVQGSGGQQKQQSVLHSTKVTTNITQERLQSSPEYGSNGDYFSAYGMDTGDNGGPSAKSRRSRDGEKLFKCRLCPKSYSFSSALSRHKAVHNTMLRPYVCPICKKGFAEPEKLERHSRTHLVDRTWRCNNCGRIFKALNTYERHVTTICSYRNKENGGSTGPLPPGLTAHAVNIIPQTVMYRNS